jgi:hypothetical protein
MYRSVIMSKRKKPDDEHLEWCNTVLRVLAELPLDILEKVAFDIMKKI